MHCKETGAELRLTAVPEEFIGELQRILSEFRCDKLENWSDYVYDIQKLATLQGKALNKKRNRYNKFIAEQPTYTYNRCTADDINEVIKFLAGNRECQNSRDDNMRCYEHWQCMATVRNLLRYEQPAGILRIDGKIAAFTLGEIFGDTLFVASHVVFSVVLAVAVRYKELGDICYVVGRTSAVGIAGVLGNELVVSVAFLVECLAL
jgi:hypothetical protein